MRLLENETIQGRKGGGGGKQHTPVEQPDDLLSDAKLKMLVVLSEGEIQGDLTAQKIYLNDTALANDDGSYNFTGVKWEYRKGTQDQPYIQGLPEVDNELSANVAVTTTVPWTRQFSNLTLDAVRIKLSLPAQYMYKDNGDMVGTVTQYAIDLSTDGAAWRTVVDGKFDGKTTSEYQRDHRIDLPEATTGWSIRVRRITADSTSAKLVNGFKVFSFAEVIDSKLRYPNSALLYIEVDSSQFSGGAPKVTCRPKGKLIRVPDTYDPVTRTYSGTWSGGFKLAYTNNPAWIFYDLVLDEIYGMGNRVDASMIDKWALYAISQYCDEKVSNGAGGTEPRFTCNVFIQSQQDAYTVLSDLAAVFRGITFWGNDQIFVRADVPQDDVDFVYHASNVIDGLFTYGSGSYKNRYSSALVSWSDPQNHYSDTVEGVYDEKLVERYNVNQMSLTAIGCTSQSEAHRRGRWAILSNARDGTISFGVGLDGYIPLPAEIIGVADPFRAGKQNGGRISAVSGRNITLDRAVDYAAGDRLVVNLPDGSAQTRTIGAVSSDKKTVTVNTAFSQPPAAGAVWAIDSDSLAIQYFRVTSISANDDSNGGFTITAVQHDPNKYRYIDDGVRIDPAPITVTPISIIPAPKNIIITEVDHVAQGLNVATMNVTWDKVAGAIRYMAQWRKDNGDWINVAVTSAQGFSIQGIYTGSYDVRVRAMNAQESSSPWGYADTTYLTGKTGKPGTPQNLLATDDVVWAIDLTWSFPDGSGDTSYTELQRATTDDKANPELLALVPYPAVSYQHGPMPAGVRQWYRARLVDRIGNVGDWTAWVMGTSSIDVSAITDDILNDMKESETFKDLIESAVDSNEKIAGMADDIKQNADELDQQAQAIADNAQKTGQLEQSVSSLDTKVDGVTSSVTQLSRSVATADAALGQRIDNISVSMDGMTGGVKNSSIAVIQNSLAQVTSRRSQTATNNGNVAKIDRIDTTIADTSQAVARALVTLDASAGGNVSNATDLTETLADFTQASATKINSLTVTVNGQTAAINQTAQAVADVNGNLNAMYNIKVAIDANGRQYAAGMGIGVQNTPAGMQSQVIFLADRFAVMSQAGSVVSLPFVIQNGQTFIRETFIQDGTISNAKIGNFIQSNNYVAGSVGWKLDKSGTLEINGNVSGQGRMVMTNNRLVSYDQNNRPAAVMGQRL